MKDVVVLSAVRTAVGTFNGGLSTVKAVDLGKEVMIEAINRAKISNKDVDEVLFGCVLQGGQGQNVARQCSIYAGIPKEVPSITINQVCGSGLRSVSLGAQTIKAGDNEVVVVGGTENMSRGAYMLEDSRWGYRMGDKNVVDTMVKDGLWDAMNDYHMGITAENVVDMYKLTREEQDKFALESQQKAAAARDSGRFKDEILPIEVPGKRGSVTIVDTDEHIRDNTTLERLAKLRPAFKKDGSVTAGNASGINDGAASLVLSSGEYAKENNLTPMAKIIGYGSVGVDPKVMGLGPIEAIKKALKNANLTIDDIDLFEVNEAFASQSIAVVNELGLDKTKVNVNGGAIAIGHPIGASGARIFITLLYEMKKRGSKYGVASLCIGGGQGTAVVVEM